jgi:ABC-2 type transport system permease protein
MAALIRGELSKLAGVRAPWLLLAAPLPLLIGAPFGIARSGSGLADPDTQRMAYAHLGLAALLPLVLGLLAVAGEHRHGAIIDTYLTEPRRGRVLAAKLAVYGALSAAAGVVYAAVTAVVTAAVWSAHGVPLPLSGADAMTALAGGALVNALFAVAGVAIGALVRNPVGALVGALAWIALVEGVLGQVLGSGLSRWLPLAADRALGAGAGTGLLPQWGGGLVLLGYAAVLAAAATATTRTRDVI